MTHIPLGVKITIKLRKFGRWWQVHQTPPQPGCQGLAASLRHMKSTCWIYFVFVCFPLLLHMLIILFQSHHLFGGLCILLDVATQKGPFASSCFVALCLYTWCQRMSSATGSAGIGLLCGWSPHVIDGDTLLDQKKNSLAADKHFLRLWLSAALNYHSCHCIIKYFFSSLLLMIYL